MRRAWWVLLVAAVGGAARAEDPCAEDTKQLCGDVKPGEGRAAICLKAHQDRLAPGCRAKLDADAAFARKTVEEFGRACKEDVDRHCAGVEPGDGRLYGCLAQHQLELSDACSGVITRFGAAKELVARVKVACTADAQRVCREHLGSTAALVDCLRENAERLSPECNIEDFARATEAAAVVSLLEDMTRQERVREALQVLQGLDSVAFSRNQILLQVDGYENIANQANGIRLLFNPQFVFGPKRAFAFQLKVPLTTLFPNAMGASAQFGLGAVQTAVAWNFLNWWRTKQYVGFAFQWETATRPIVGAPWAVAPSYAFAIGFARWVSLTVQVVWFRSVSGNPAYPVTNLLIIEPIVVFNLPGRSFVALDQRFGIDFATGLFIPVLKVLAGLYTDRQKSLSISAWYQASLTQQGVAKSFKYGVGLGLAYYFDWN
ncbi:MAG: cysteine rich repeat-containing protein [Myxococcales bacterium]|nr:cysteine rich repeat-containing protein [Myxococcales bacterium]